LWRILEAPIIELAPVMGLEEEEERVVVVPVVWRDFETVWRFIVGL
jgi:hypothetical protein